MERKWKKGEGVVGVVGGEVVVGGGGGGRVDGRLLYNVLVVFIYLHPMVNALV